MSTPILATKLYIPLPRSKIVLRPHLIERLNEGLHHKLTLISAPAGFGKTTMISEWVQAIGGAIPPVAVTWLSLDEGDKDLTRFLTYLVAAVQTVAPNVGVGVMSALQSPQPPSTESILTALLNEIAALPKDFILILDDYHVIESKPVDASTSVDNALTFLLEHQPPQMHLVITTREDPQLPLARLRGRGQLTELRLADLRFTPDEAAKFLNQVMGLKLSEADIAVLETRTEGWIAGLQLAAISMQGQTDAAGFIQSFTGSHRFVLDYLIEEVLHKQPENIQNFLLSTSILDRMCGPLCDALLQDAAAPAPETGGQKTLEYLERINLFLIPLDNKRRWYRYHSLFAELLRMRLVHRYPGHATELHRRASDWYARNDLPDEAVTHALVAQDWTRAAELIEGYSRSMWLHGEIGTLRAWLESFPARLRLERIKLGLVFAWTLTMANEMDRAEQHLDQMMPLVQPVPVLLGELLAVRVMIAAYRSDMPAVIKLAQQALSLVSPDDLSVRSMIMLCLGVAYYDMSDDIKRTKRAFQEVYDLGKIAALSNSSNKDPSVLVALAYLAELEWLQGNLGDASRMYEQACELSEKWGGQVSLARVHWGRASLFYERNDLDRAAHALQESIRSGELWNDPHVLVHSYGLSALVMQARRQTDASLAMIRRAEQITRDWYSSPVTLGSLALYQIALWIAQNDFQAITRWEQGHKSEWYSQIGRARDILAIVLAQAYVARHYQQHDDSALTQAHALIEPVLEKAKASDLMFNVARLLVLKALAQYAQRDTASAITTLKRGLALAEPENYIRSFLDLGKPMGEFLTWSLESPALGEPHLRLYVSRLLSHFSAGLPSKSNKPTGDTLVEPLSERELEVLRLIAQGLSNQEITQKLFVALSTVKGHNLRIFAKLDVNSRTEAVARARDLGLL